MQNEKLAQWITTKAENPDTSAIRYRLSGQLPSGVDNAILRVIASDLYRLWLNGKPVGISEDWQGDNWQVTGIAKPGINVIEAEIRTRKTVFAGCWLNMDKTLPAPVPVSQIEFTVRDARLSEWIYVQFIDAGNPEKHFSGLFCVEAGRDDLKFDTSGAPRTVRINTRTEKQLGPNAAFDWTRVSQIRLRIDQKSTLVHPKGGLTLSDMRIDGTPVGLTGWVVSPGLGPIDSQLITDTPNELRLNYDFSSYPETSLLCELSVADRHGVKLAQIISDEQTTTDQGTPRLAPSTYAVDWTPRLPARVSDMLDEGRVPCHEMLSISTTDRKELYEQDHPIELNVVINAFDKPSDPKIQIQLDEWNHTKPVFLSAECRINQAGQMQDTLALPKLSEGLYRVTARKGTGLMATAAFAVVPKSQTTISSLLPKLKPYNHRQHMIGVNDGALLVQHPVYLWSLREMGVGLLVADIVPSNTETGVTNDICAYCKATDTRFAYNLMMSNYTAVSDSTNGKNSYDAPDGCHRWDVDADTLRHAAATGLFEGVMYDEVEHMQLCRNAYSQQPEPNRKPFFVETNGLSLPQAYDTLKKAVKEQVKRYQQFGSKMLGESVFPALWHPMAEAGMTLAPKLLKEDVHPVVLAEALGAAIQHNARLWFSPDLWWYAEAPGHSAREFQMAMQCCHLAGVDACYVECTVKLFSQNGSSYNLTQHGKVLKEHIARWIPAHPRSYTYRDYQPEVAIVRFPDSDWGQSSCAYWDYLYGAMNLHSSAETREHLQVWSLITDRVLTGRAVNCNAAALGPLIPPIIWRFTVPSPAVAVFDHNVGLKHLQGLGVIFACGIEISEQTMSALQSCVKAGAVCFIIQHLAPQRLRELNGAPSTRISEGKGSWVVMDSFTPEAMAPYKQLLPKNDGSMWLRFKNRRVKVG
ncbi:MAG: hypothetical protein ACYC1M_14705 [Armatimonadota bacterium]